MEGKTGSKTNLNESTLPLLDEHKEDGKGDTPEKEEKIELETKGDKEKDDVDTEKKDEKKDKKKEKKSKKAKDEKKDGNCERCPLRCPTHFTTGLNVIDRDDKHLNDHVNLTFDDILAEPDANQSFEFLWRLVFIIFNFTRVWLYRLLAAVLALPFAFLWAIIFAFINLTSIWLCTPAIRVYQVLLYHLHKIWSGFVHSLLDPFFESGSLLFAKNNKEAGSKEINV